MTKDRQELKPCPFCGSPGMVIHNSVAKRLRWYGTCWHWNNTEGEDACPSCPSTGEFVKKEDAVKAWNIRADTLGDDEYIITLQTEVEALKFELGTAIALVQSYGPNGPVIKARLATMRALLSPVTKEGQQS